MTVGRSRAADLRVLMVGTSYPANDQDWQGRFVADMAMAIGKREDVDLTLWAPPGELPSGVSSGLLGDDADWLRVLSQRGGIASLLRRGIFHGGMAAAGLLRRLWRAYRSQPIDVVHVNWLQNALPLWGTRLPALVTVLGSDFSLLKLPGMASALRRVFSQRRTILAPNAGWMIPRLTDLFGDVAEIRPVYFGVASRWFDIERQPVAPERWLVVSRLTQAKLGPLFEWGAGLFGQERELHLFGPMQENIAVPLWVHYHGPADPAGLLRVWFPQAAGLLTLSCHDEGRPQVLLEAMAAGLPVIASGLHAHRDFIRDGETGYIVSSAEELGNALQRLSIGEHGDAIGENAKHWALDSIGSWDDCAARYVSAYDHLLSDHSWLS